MVRVVLGGGAPAGSTRVGAPDASVTLASPPDGAPYDAVFEPAQVRDEHPQETWPARRRYTVRDWDADRQRLTIDFVVHGDTGVAGAWAMSARPGDVLVFEGPSGGYVPESEAHWLLMVGDESALPAIAASLEAVPAGATTPVRPLCDGPQHEVDLACAGDVELAWVHRRGDERDESLLAEAVRDLTFPPGRVHAFVHGEADEIRQIRRHLLSDRGLTRQDMSCSPYWRRDMTDEAWRKVKRDFVAAMEDDVALTG